ncbi:MAG: transglutaminaseTgpA domain-containing protein, partial [Xanthomonadales bacterium]|nr:transglutaminaseTgpA domain-containing protein [Xanthomonadales bacterium]
MITPNRNTLDWVVLTLVLAMIPQFTHMPLHLVAAACAPVLWRVIAQRREWKPPGLVVRLVLAGTALGLLLATYGGLLGRRAAVSLLTLMLALKLIEAYKLRDARVIVSMSLFLAGTQFLFQQGVLMVLYGAAVVACALVAMVHLQRQEAFAPRKRPPRV